VSKRDPEGREGQLSAFALLCARHPVLAENNQFTNFRSSSYVFAPPATDGRFGDVDLASYWIDDWKHPFLIRVEGKLAGFALISERSKITGDRGIFDMTEFFVLRRFRRQGVGRAAAFAAFKRFPGLWELRQREENPSATTFWRRTIDQYTHGKYKENRWVRPQWTEVVQTFSRVIVG
jgi:predicted acetyltransferase